MRKLSYLLIIAGIVVVLLPHASEWYHDRKQAQLLEQITASFEELYQEEAEDPVQSRYLELSNIFEQEPTMERMGQSSSEESMAQHEESATQDEQRDNEPVHALPIATIEISKIDLKLPVLEGATQENMKIAATHMTETSPLGEIGNAAIAAHRMRTKGKMFNRLDEVDLGDEIVVKVDGQEFVYTVFNVSIVEPTDVSVLNRNNRDKILTLITCDPIVNPTHRLIVHAKIEERTS